MPRTDLIQLRHGTPAQWSTADPILGLGEPGVSIVGGVVVIKVGDGATHWDDLAPANEGEWVAAISGAISTARGAANGLASLDGTGKIPAAQIPDVALSQFLGDTASQAAMLALAGQPGDWTVRTDLDPDQAFILVGSDPAVLGSWRNITTPGAVLSVNSRVGAVTGLAEQVDLDQEITDRDAGDTALGGLITALADDVADLQTDKADLVSPVGDGVATWDAFGVTGLTGAVTPVRFVGGTASGPPVAGTFIAGDYVVALNGVLWVCTVGGTPGTWVDASSSGHQVGYAESSAVQTGIAGTATDITGLSVTFTVVTKPVIVTAWLPYLLSVTAGLTFTAQLTDAGGTKKQGVSGQMAAATNWATARVEEHFTTPGTYTRKLQVLRALGTGTITVNADATTAAYIEAVVR